MSEHVQTVHAGPGYETSDVHTGPIYKFIFALVLLMVFGIVIAIAIFWGLYGAYTEDYAQMKTTAMQDTRQVPPGPLLQVSNHQDLLDFREVQARQVSGHATWLDKNAQVVRLPIERALELVSERGLPNFQATAAPATGAAK
jgi:hypothetical protein